MATITTDTFLDDGTARTAGETWTINGCNLTIRTDTRWHAGAPASMTGSLAGVSISSSLGGGFIVNSTAVRWMAFDTGTGNVPAIGTTVTQGGVSGYLLGVWADYISAPTVVGAAMPASGFLKFREVTGGTYSVGALTGIGANASSVDVQGWIEIAKDAATNFTAQELGDGIKFQGAWFYLDNTNGSRGQQISTPTNGGGSTTHVVGVQIETSAGSGVYEWFPSAHVTLGAAAWTTANLTTDLRAKFVESMGNGVIRIGSDGTNNIGYLPPTGCKVRIPNILGQSVATASRAVNQVPAAVTRPQISGGNYNIDYLHSCYQMPTSSPAINFTIKNSAFDFTIGVQDNSAPFLIDNCSIGGFTGGAANNLMFARVNYGVITNTKCVNSGYSIGAVRFDTVSNLTFNNLEIIGFKTRTAASAPFYATALSNSTFTNTKIKSGGSSFTSCNNLTFTNTDYIDRLEGNTTINTAVSVLGFTGCNNITVDGFTFGEAGQVANTQPYTSIVIMSGNNNGVKLRNFGTRNNPLNSGSSATYYPAYIFSMATGDINVKAQRCYLTGTRTYPFFMSQTNTIGMCIEDVFGTYSQTISGKGREATIRKFGGILSGLDASNPGTHWLDCFTSDTAGKIMWSGSSPTAATLAKNYMVVTPNKGTGYVSAVPFLSLDTINDYAISESEWEFKGHTSFQNVNPTVSSNAAGVVLYYQLNKAGAGWGGTWIPATGANLSAETSLAAGFKMKLKMVQESSGQTASALQLVTFLTNSTLAAQADNLYPLDTNTLTFTGLVTGSEVRCYTGTDPATSVEIGGIESTTGSTFSFTHSSGGTAGYIMIFALGYQPVYIPYTYLTTDDSILIQPVIDRNYNNPA